MLTNGMRCVLVLLSLLLTGCGSLPPSRGIRYQIWRTFDPPQTYACRVAPETPVNLAELVRASLGPAGMYEENGDTAVQLTLRLDVGPPKMTVVEPRSHDWHAATDDRKFVEVVDHQGRVYLLPGTHPSAPYATRHAVLLTRSCLFIEARHDGQQLWCAELVVIAPEDDPAQIAALFHPAMVEVLLHTSAEPVPRAATVVSVEHPPEAESVPQEMSLCTRM